MPTIETLSERPKPVAPTTLGCEVLARFNREPDTLVIPVVDGDRPVGLVERTAFLEKIAARFGHALYDLRPITFAMDAEPAVVEAGVRIDAFCDIMLKGGPAALLRGFIVTRHGAYLGVRHRRDPAPSGQHAPTRTERATGRTGRHPQRHPRPGHRRRACQEPVPGHHEP